MLITCHTAADVRESTCGAGVAGDFGSVLNGEVASLKLIPRVRFRGSSLYGRLFSRKHFPPDRYIVKGQYNK